MGQGSTTEIYKYEAGWVPFLANISNIHLLSLQAVLRTESRTTQLSIHSTVVVVKVTKIEIVFFHFGHMDRKGNLKFRPYGFLLAFPICCCPMVLSLQALMKTESCTTQLTIAL